MMAALAKSAVAAIALMGFAGVASAQVMAQAVTDLNVRSGPGPEYPVVGAIMASGHATVSGCIEGSKWCQVSASGVEGWAYSDYLTTAGDNQQMVVLTERQSAVPMVTYETTASTGENNAGALTGVATGAIAGAIIGGPVGAAVGGAAGAIAGGTIDTVTPPQEVITYVQQNRPDPVYLEGEVVVGASLPETVQVQEIPDYEYRYVTVNGQPVLVEPDTRRIVYVVR